MKFYAVHNSNNLKKDCIWPFRMSQLDLINVLYILFNIINVTCVMQDMWVLLTPITPMC